MDLQISSDKIGNPQLIQLLKLLTNCFEKVGIPYFVIGATARDIVMTQLANTASQRRTKDLDIAIAIPNWNKFEEVEQVLIAAGLTKSNFIKQRFYMGDYELDVVPYGGINKQNEKIYWPPEEEIAMSVKGFDEVLSDAITVSIDGNLDVKIASLPGLFLLKFNAWMDRHDRTDKDAEDMSFILENYFDANVDRGFHPEIFDRADFDVYVCGGNWLAYDLLSLLSTEKLIYFRDCILNEINKGIESILLRQICESNSLLHFEQIEQTWREIADIFDTKIKEEQMLESDGSEE